MRVRRPLPLSRRVPALAVALTLPLGVAACGQVEQAQRRTVEAELQSASTALLDAGAVQVRLGLTDPSGTARRALTTGTDPAPGPLADVLLGGSITVTVDPTGTRTMRDLQAMDPATPSAEVFDAVNAAITVEAQGGPVAQLRLVGGDLYGTVDLERVSGIAVAAGEPDAAGLVDALAQEAPPELAPLVEDVQAGQWVRLPLAPYADALDELVAAQPSPAPTGLAGDLLAAVRPFVQVTDAGGDAGERVLDVQVQARPALQALLDAFGSAVPELGDVPDLTGEIGDGTAAGRVVLQDGHLRSVAVDLGSLARLSPDAAAPDLSGSTVTVTVDDAAGEVTAPTPVSDVEVVELLEGALEGLLGQPA